MKGFGNKAMNEPREGRSNSVENEMTNSQDQKWFSLSEAAKYTRTSESFLRNQVAKGKLKSTKTSGETGRLRFRLEWLEEFMLGGSDGR